MKYVVGLFVVCTIVYVAAQNLFGAIADIYEGAEVIV